MVCGEWAAGPGHPEPSPSQQPPPSPRPPLAEESGLIFFWSGREEEEVDEEEEKKGESCPNAVGWDLSSPAHSPLTTQGSPSCKQPMIYGH